MADAAATENTSKFSPTQPEGITAVLVLADGSTFWGNGVGTAITKVGEVCFNTAMTGYQEIITDPSYAGQIITFTFPHIGNVGSNLIDMETQHPHCLGLVTRASVTTSSNYRSIQNFDTWLKSVGVPGITGVDTRRLTRHIRELGAPNGALCYEPNGIFNIPMLQEKAANWPGLNGMDLALEVTCNNTYVWTGDIWSFHGENKNSFKNTPESQCHVVAMDFGAKHNIFRYLSTLGCKISVVPANTSAEEILSLKPDGVFLSNGPGDPSETGKYAVPVIAKLIKTGKPIFGICLGHQLLSIALGAKTEKMHLGHRGANHPVKNLMNGKVEITSQNHGFVISEGSLDDSVEITHRSLFDGSIEGLKVCGKPIFSVQYHPEASPGPQDSNYLFEHFVNLMKEIR